MDTGHHNETATQFARALFDLALVRKETTKMLQAAERLSDIYRASRDFRLFAANPRFTKESITRVLEALDAKLEFGTVLRRSLDLLVQTRLLALFPKIFEQLQRLAEEQRGEVKVHVVSANTLSTNERRAVKEALSTSLSTPSTTKEGGDKSLLSLSFSDDPALLSGLVMTMQSRMIDLSLRSELRRLRRALDKNLGGNLVVEARVA